MRHLYHFKYLPLSACHERQHGAELQQISQAIGLLLSLDGLMRVGGKRNCGWCATRSGQTEWTLRSGWLLQQDKAAFVEFLRPMVDLDLHVTALMSDKQVGLRQPSPTPSRMLGLVSSGLSR